MQGIDMPQLERPNGFAAELLEGSDDWKTIARRSAVGALLASVYGVALGTREGGLALLTHAVGTPAALLAVCGLGVPALYIALALFDAPLSLGVAANAAARGCASAGLVLAGLAPLVALYVIGSDTDAAASLAGSLGLALGGLLGLRHLTATLRSAIADADSATRTIAGFAQVAFAIFAIVLAWRVWAAVLPLVGGAQ